MGYLVGCADGGCGPGSRRGLGGEEVEVAGGGIHEESVDLDVRRHEGVMADHADGGVDAFGGGCEAGEPGLEIDAGVPEGIEGGIADAGGAGLLNDFVVSHAGHAAVMVADDVDFFSAEGVDGDEDGAHDGAEGGGDDGTGDFDNFGIAIFEVHGFGEELGEAGVHAGDDDDFFIGEAVGAKGFVGLGGDEFAVEVEDGGEFGHGQFVLRKTRDSTGFASGMDGVEYYHRFHTDCEENSIGVPLTPLEQLADGLGRGFGSRNDREYRVDHTRAIFCFWRRFSSASRAGLMRPASAASRPRLMPPSIWEHSSCSCSSATVFSRAVTRDSNSDVVMRAPFKSMIADWEAGEEWDLVGEFAVGESTRSRVRKGDWRSFTVAVAGRDGVEDVIGK